MANEKITGLAAQSTLLDTDLFVIVDTTDTSMAPSGTDKNITAANIIDGVKTALVTVPDTRIPFGDATSDLTTDANLTYAASTVTTPNLLVKTSVKLEETGAGTDTITMQAPSSIAASYTLTMPGVVGTTGQVLTAADNAGTLTFATNASGDVVGPASATDNAITRFDSTTGKLIQNSVGILSDVGALSGLTQLDVDNVELNGNTISSTDTNGNINLEPNGTGITTSTKAIKSQTGFIFEETGAGTDAITVVAPNNIASSYTFTLPPDAGTVGYTLQAAGGGLTQWSNVNAGDVDGPASSVAHTLATFADTTGKLLENISIVASTGASGAIGFGTGATATGANAIAIGTNAKASLSGVVAIGSGALSSMTTGSGGNVAIGLNAGSTITTAASNVIIGSGAKGAAIDGSNTIVGANAGSTTMTTANTAIGQGALASANGCSSNVAIGNNALGTGAVSATGQNANTAVGSASLFSLTSGTQNVAIGVSTGANLTTGISNTVVGANALDDAAAAVSNWVAIGTGAAGASVTAAADGGVAVGSGALSAVTSGAHNTAVGYNGGGSVATTTGSNNTCVGYAIISAATVSNNTLIGNQVAASTIGGATAVGSSASVSATDGVAIGRAATVTSGTGNIALGTSAQATGSTTGAIAIGNGTVASAQGAIALGTGVTNNVVNSLFLPTTLVSTTGTALTYNASGQVGPLTSSIRFKEDVKDARDLTGSIDKIRVVDYIRKETGIREIGLIAEEVVEIYPELVPLDLEGKPFSVDYARLTLALIQEVQSLRKEINILKK